MLLAHNSNIPERFGNDYWLLTLRQPDIENETSIGSKKPKRIVCFKKTSANSDIQVIRVAKDLSRNYFKIRPNTIDSNPALEKVKAS